MEGCARYFLDPQLLTGRQKDRIGKIFCLIITDGDHFGFWWANGLVASHPGRKNRFLSAVPKRGECNFLRILLSSVCYNSIDVQS